MSVARGISDWEDTLVMQAVYFGFLVRDRRGSKSLRKFGAEVGVPETSIRRIESGHEPTMKAGRSLAGVVNKCPCCGQGKSSTVTARVSVETSYFMPALRALRGASTLRELAAATGVVPSVLRGIEGGREPTMETARRLGPVVKRCPCCEQVWPA